MHLKLANNMKQDLSSGKDDSTNYVSIATPTGSGTPFYAAFGSSRPADSPLIPITVCQADNTVLFSGYVVNWNFGSEDGKIFIDSRLASEVIPPGCYISCRIRAEHVQGGTSVMRSHTGWGAYSDVVLPPTCERHYVVLHATFGASCAITMPGYSAIEDDLALPNESVVRSHEVVLVNLPGNTAPTALTFSFGSEPDTIHWKDGSYPSFSNGYNRLILRFSLAETGNWPGTAHWLGSWEKYAD